jgi:hypothetical protein
MELSGCLKSCPPAYLPLNLLKGTFYYRAIARVLQGLGVNSGLFRPPLNFEFNCIYFNLFLFNIQLCKAKNNKACNKKYRQQ